MPNYLLPKLLKEGNVVCFLSLCDETSVKLLHRHLHYSRYSINSCSYQPRFPLIKLIWNKTAFQNTENSLSVKSSNLCKVVKWLTVTNRWHTRLHLLKENLPHQWYNSFIIHLLLRLDYRVCPHTCSYEVSIIIESLLQWLH